MGTFNKKITVADGEADETFVVDVATLVSDVHSVFLSKRRKQTFLQPWNKMTEEDQQDEIVAMENLAEMVIRKVVDLVASKGMPTIPALLENFTMKDQKLTLKIASMDEDATILALAHNINKTVRIMMVDTSQFDTSRVTIAPMADQPDLLSHEAAAEAELGAADADDLAAQVQEAFGGGEGDEDEGEGTPIGPDGKPLTPQAEGYQARLDGTAVEANPFNDETDEAMDWLKGWKAASAEIEGLHEKGRSDYLNEVPKSKSGFKKETDAFKYWYEGWESAKAETEDEPPAPANDLDQEQQDFNDAAKDL